MLTLLCLSPSISTVAFIRNDCRCYLDADIAVSIAIVVDEQKSVSVDDWPSHVAKLHADSNLGFAQEYDVSRQYLIRILHVLCVFDVTQLT